MEPEDKVRTGDTVAVVPGSAGFREGRGLLCVQRPKGRYEQVQCVRGCGCSGLDVCVPAAFTS